MSKKALFFDVDGTLLSEVTGEVPESASRALAEARRQGHLVFINSGRVICLIEPMKHLVKADGYLCGCGTYVMVGGEVIYFNRIPHERGIQLKELIQRYGFDGILEGAESCYCRKETSRMPLVERLREVTHRGGNLSPYGWDEHCYEYDKFCVIADEHSDREGLFESLKPDIDVIDRGDDFYECVPAGHTKATAIEMVLEWYGIPLEDAYVFGDSANDLPMFQYAKNAVLMGKHDEVLEPYATFITKTVEEDGVAYAMKELGLI